MDVSRVRPRLAELSRRDRERRLFGASTHGYELAEPVQMELLSRAEATLGRELPPAYRRFLCEVGNGGAGPYHGILSLEQSLERAYELTPIAPDDVDDPRAFDLNADLPTLPALTRDFPLETDVDFGELVNKPISFDEHVRQLDTDPAYAARWQELTAEYLSPPFDGGTLPICDFGCGDFFVLVLRGPRRGTIWVNSVFGATGYYCLETEFDGFYERWLEDAEQRVNTQQFAPANARYSYLRYGENRRYQPIDFVPKGHPP